MDKYWPLIIIFLLVALLTALAFSALWATWLAPRKIRRAVADRLSPRSISAAIKASPWYWIFTIALSLGCGAGAAWWSWRYLAAWLYNAVGGWQEQLAIMLSNTAWVWQLPEQTLQYSPFISVGAAASLLVGVLVGAVVGTLVGSRIASKRFLITRAMV